MKQIIHLLLLAGLLPLHIFLCARADVLDNWTTNQITTNSFGMHHVVYGNGIFVAVGEKGDSGGFYTSVDGQNWKLQYSEPNSWGVTLNYSGGRFAGVCVGLGSGVVDVSADGTNWTTTLFSMNGLPAFAPKAIVYGNSLYVAVGSTNSIACIFTSPDGITWTPRKASTTPGGQIYSVAYGASKFVAVGADGLEYTSATGTGTWGKTSFPGTGLISFANGLFISPLNNKTNVIALDGVNWSLKPTGLTNQLGAVTYGNGVFMAQCGLPATPIYFASSTDGTNWFQYSRPLPNRWGFYTGNGPYDVSLASDGTRLIAVGSDNYISPPYGNGFIFDSGLLVGTRMTNSPPRSVVVSGLVGRNYQVQSKDSLSADNNWRTNVTVQLTNTPIIWTDTSATNAARFYRTVLLP